MRQRLLDMYNIIGCTQLNDIIMIHFFNVILVFNVIMMHLATHLASETKMVGHV